MGVKMATIMPARKWPKDMAFALDGTKAYVVNQKSNNVSVIDTATDKIVATIPVGKLSWFVTFIPDRTKAYAVWLCRLYFG
jgi:YVTN family beta-propeller protein